MNIICLQCRTYSQRSSFPGMCSEKCFNLYLGIKLDNSRLSSFELSFLVSSVELIKNKGLSEKQSKLYNKILSKARFKSELNLDACKAALILIDPIKVKESLDNYNWQPVRNKIGLLLACSPFDNGAASSDCNGIRFR